MRVGLYGGTFDPPHQAHRVLADVAISRLQLDQLVVMPTGSAWYKSRALSDGKHRLAMTRLAFAECPLAVVDDLEIKRVGPCYTIDTLAYLHQSLVSCELFLVIGADQAAKLGTWHRWRDIVNMAHLAVADRQENARTALAALGIGDFTVLPMPDMLVSSTAIRTQIAQGLNPLRLSPSLLAPPVARYIQEQGLYQPTFTSPNTNS